MSTESESENRPYTKGYLNGLAIGDLLELVSRESSKWPKDYLPDVTTSEGSVRKILLNPKYNFQRPPSPPPPINEDASSVANSLADKADEESLEHSIEKIEIKVLLEDQRPNGDKLLVSQRVLVPPAATDRVFGASNPSEVIVADLFAAIQASQAHISGVGKLMFRDPDESDGEFWMVLVRFTPHNDPIFSSHDQLLPIPEDHKLRLKVISDEESLPSSKGKRRASESQPDTDLPASDSEHINTSDDDAEKFPLVKMRKRQRKAERQLSQDVQSLQKKISKLTGYAAFTKARGARKMQNAQAVAYWSFISTATNNFMGKTAAKTQGLVDKTMICEALAIKEGTHRTGMLATKILETHAADDEVVERMKEEDGSVALFKYLEELSKRQA